MLRILEKLLPSFLFHYKNRPTVFLHTGLISISIEDSCFLLEISYDDSLSSHSLTELLHTIQNSIAIIYPKQEIEINFVPSIPIDKFNHHKISFLVTNKVYQFFLLFPLDFINYLSNELQYTYCFQASNFLDLQLELYRFRPHFLQENLWFSLPEKELKDLFYYLLSQNLVTIKMFALFFKKIPLPNISLYFSQRIAKEILEEMNLLTNLEDQKLLDTIYYIIERNFIIFIQKSYPSSLKEFSQQLFFYQSFFYQHTLPSVNLSNSPFFQQLLNSKKLPILLKKIPYESILSFLQHSDPKNTDLLKKGFSSQGFSQISENLRANSYPIIKSKSFLKFLAQLEYQYSSLDVVSAFQAFITKDRHWELLAKEVDIEDLLLTIDVLPLNIKNQLTGTIQILYKAYHHKIIIFPQITNRNIFKAQEHCAYTIYYLKLLDMLI